MSDCRESREASSHASQRRRTHEDWRTWVLAVLLLSLSVTGFGSCRAADAARDANRAVEDVAGVERQDRDTNRATAFRLCSRNKIDRAYAHARERGIPIEGLPAPRPMSRAERRLRVSISRSLMQTPSLVILDCEPNLMGHGARPLPIAEQERFMRRWAAHKLTDEELGICPASRLEGEHPAGRC